MKFIPGDIVNPAAVTVDSIKLSLLPEKGVQMDVLRLDNIHPVISGNKWFKLQYYLADALHKGYPSLLTFGGAWSNHIVATACATEKAGMKSIGIIRGEQPATYSQSLQTAVRHGMQLVFVPREQYALLKQHPLSLQEQYPDAVIVPEGGEGEKGIRGASEILQLVNTEKYSHIICALGTGTMALGLAMAAGQQQVITIPVLKGFEHWKENKASVTGNNLLNKLTIINGYHFGGYAKKNSQLLDFMNSFYRQTGIPSDFVYTGKMFFAAMDLISRDFFPPGSSILAIHSGGLQGNQSLPAQSLQF